MDFCVARLNADGTLDTAFDGPSGSGNGKFLLPIGAGTDRANAVALQPDGKIVLAGYCHNGSNDDFCVARLNTDGTLDTSFDGPSGSGNGKFLLPISTSSDVAEAVAIQPDGKIVLAGNCGNSAIPDFCVARLNPDGTLDTSFDGPSGASDGKFTFPIGTSSDRASAVALQPDGKIVVAGACFNGSNGDFCLARYLPSGALDTTFNTTGNVIAAIGSDQDAAYALALQPDGKIVVAGACWNGNSNDFCLARYLPSGALDTSFNTTGTAITHIVSGNSVATAVALQPDGKIVAAGHCSNGSNHDFCLARYLASGALDTSFNTTGKVITAIGLIDDDATALALQPDGKIVAAGSCWNGSSNDFCLARYLPSGALDPSFNGSGKVITAIGSDHDAAFALALQPDGKIVAAGQCYNGGKYELCLARYEGGPFDARNCSMDIDGDNLVLATTDSLIHARIALGLTGNAVIGGITFASHATRTTWPAIRDYLVSQCGMSIVP